MPRTKRADEAGRIYHALNRGNDRRELFHKPEDYLAFLRTLQQGLEKYPVDLLAYCQMPTHWHLVARSEDCPFGSLHRWHAGNDRDPPWLAAWPIRRLRHWLRRVNASLSKKELEVIQNSVKRGCPYGSKDWIEQTCERTGIWSATRPRGRPRSKPQVEAVQDALNLPLSPFLECAVVTGVLLRKNFMNSHFGQNAVERQSLAREKRLGDSLEIAPGRS